MRPLTTISDIEPTRSRYIKQGIVEAYMYRFASAPLWRLILGDSNYHREVSGTLVRPLNEVKFGQVMGLILRSAFPPKDGTHDVENFSSFDRAVGTHA